jgi:hypothetical protein
MGGRLHLAVVGSDGSSIWYAQVDPATLSCTWTKIKGSTSFEPSLATDGSNIYLVVRGGDSRVYVNTWSGSWGSWERVPTGSTSSGPASAFYSQLYIVVRGNDNGIYYAYRTGPGSYSAWSRMGGSTPSSPAATGS